MFSCIRIHLLNVYLFSVVVATAITTRIILKFLIDLLPIAFNEWKNFQFTNLNPANHRISTNSNKTWCGHTTYKQNDFVFFYSLHRWSKKRSTQTICTLQFQHMCTNSLKSVFMGLIEKKMIPYPYSLFILIMFHICDQYTANALITSTRDE